MKSITLFLFVVSALCVYCNSSEKLDITECSSAVEHYYANGCAYFSPETGERYNLSQAASICREGVRMANDSGCISEGVNMLDAHYQSTCAAVLYWLEIHACMMYSFI